MYLSASPILYLAIFGGVFFMVLGGVLLFFGHRLSHGARLDRRFTMIRKLRSARDQPENLRKTRRRPAAHVLPLLARLHDRARESSAQLPGNGLVVITLGLGLICFAVLSLWAGTGLVFSAGMSAIFAFGAVSGWVSYTTKQRRNMIEQQLPDALDLIVRSLQVGHPLGASLATAAQEISGPLGVELGLIADEIAYGRAAADAIADLAERIDQQDLRFMAVAVSIHQKSGGNLAEVLDGLSRIVRARFKLFRRVRAITAEAKWSGMFLSGFPIAALILMLILKPDYYDTVRASPLFLPLAGIAGLLLVLNVLYMRKMTDIRV